ncbi:MFS general substrate transporter [Lentinula edodes]|nr:MFS general substrate transporter [Lentinula edodes]
MPDRGITSNAEPDVPSSSPTLSVLVRLLLVAIFSWALFVDAFMTSAMVISLDKIGLELRVTASVIPWLITAYNLTFGSFLLLAGRISDMYHPKPVFVTGFFLLGVLGIGGGFSQDIISFIVIRAFQGIGAAMTIPSATSMLTAMYTTPKSQGLVLTMQESSQVHPCKFFAAAGTLGLSLGFVLGGVLLQFATWRWVLWIVPVLTIPLSIVSYFFIPKKIRLLSTHSQKRLDVIGILTLIGSLILLIYALSQAPINGWATSIVLAPLLVSLFMMGIFFFRQTRLPEYQAVIPTKMWFIPNFSVLVFISFCTQINLTGPILVLSQYWPIAYNWTPLSIGLHVLPMGLTSTLVCTLLPRQILQLPPRPALVGASSMAGLSSILLVYSSSREKYWSFTFPSLILITVGSTAAYMISNVGIVMSVPSEQVGVAAAIFSAAQQVGSAINIAILTTILVQLMDQHPYPSYTAPSSALWFLVALGVIQAIVVLSFYHPKSQACNNDKEDIEMAIQ